MNTLKEQLQTQEEVLFPHGLHERIAGRLFIERMRMSLIGFCGLFSISFLFSAFHFVVQVIDAEIPALVQLAIQDFDWSVSHVIDFTLIIAQEMPQLPTILFALHSVMAILLVGVVMVYTRAIQRSNHGVYN